MINRVVLVGRLTKDSILRRTPSGTSVASFTIACDKRDGNGNKSADFINCVCWGKVAENTNTYTRKGSLVGVEGRIQTRNYDDKNGNRVFVTEVVADSIQFLEPKGSSNNQAQSNSVTTQFDQIASEVNESFAHATNAINAMSEDLPF